MTRVSQATARPTTVLHARNLETGDEALVLTSPIDAQEPPNLLHLAESAGWEQSALTGNLRPARRTRESA
jgi:hypothetical protein